jgi:hypothetical protein
MDWSRERNKASWREPLTSCRVQREGQVKTLKKSKRERGTHHLSSAGRTSQDAGREREGNMSIEQQVRTSDTGNQGPTDIKLGSNLLQQEAIQKAVLRLTQSDGNASMHSFITFSVLPRPSSSAEWTLNGYYAPLILVP